MRPYTVGANTTPHTAKANGNKTIKYNKALQTRFVPYQLPQLPIRTGLVLWLDVTNHASITLGPGPSADGTGVAQWSDLSGAGNHCTQAVPANQPTYGGAGARYINGYTAIETVASTQLLASPLTAADTSTSSFGVFVLDTAGGNKNLIGASAGTGRRISAGAAGSNKLEVIKHGSAPSIGVYDGETIVTGTPCAFSVRQQINGANWETTLAYYRAGGVNTPEQDTLAIATVPAYGATTTQIFASATAGFFDGIVGELLVYDSLLSATDAQLIIDYLRAKWGF